MRAAKQAGLSACAADKCAGHSHYAGVFGRKLCRFSSADKFSVDDDICAPVYAYVQRQKGKGLWQAVLHILPCSSCYHSHYIGDNMTHNNLRLTDISISSA